MSTGVRDEFARVLNTNKLVYSYTTRNSCVGGLNQCKAPTRMGSSSGEI